MTDQYPPFRLDQGGDDPSTSHVALSPLDPRLTSPGPTAPGPATAPAAPPPPPSGQSHWGAGRVIAVIVGSVIVMGSLALALPAAGLLVVNSTSRDSAGFLVSPTRTFTSPAYALTSGRLEITSGVSGTDVPHALLGDAKVTAESAGAGPVFVGVARTADVRGYLQGVARSEVVSLTRDRTGYRTVGGGAPTVPPTASRIWLAQSEGTGVQSVTWPVSTGNWTVVVMNADGGRGVSADVAAGATVPAFGWVLAGLWGVAVVGLLLGILVLVVAVRGARRA